ncbi:MAG: DNA polymerase III subunit gamma/tau, partial [Candidatus Adiutrix sp.]|nr:DNA polymerase III subunit gamma/tau [Candidatus Adiutrix sp.]
MSYLVLARKYRPQTFADLVGQEQVSRSLKNALATGRVAHAYLFTGPRGVGKTTAARLLSMSLTCLAEDPLARPCGHCENCLEIQNGQAVDVIEVDGASNRGINEIRELRETVKFLPAKSRAKVYIIDEVHALTKDAFNALLKTLEEPPAHVVFIFATTEAHRMPATILSRCQRYDFRRIQAADIAKRLAQVAELENIPAEPEALDIIARQAEGGLRDSLSLMDQAIALGRGAITAEDVRQGLGLIDPALVGRIMESILEGRAGQAVAAVDEAYRHGCDFKNLALKLLEYSRGLALIKVDRRNADLLNLTETEAGNLAAAAGRHSLPTLHRHFESWLKFQGEAGFSPQPRWLMEAQVIRLASLPALMPLADLAARLERLLASNPPPRPPAAASALMAPTPPPGRQELPPAEPAPAKPPTMEPSPSAPPTDWPGFLRRHARELGSSALLLKNSQAKAWGPETVEIVLGLAEGNAAIPLLSAALPPLLEKAWGGRKPELIIRGGRNAAPG